MKFVSLLGFLVVSQNALAQLNPCTQLEGQFIGRVVAVSQAGPDDKKVCSYRVDQLQSFVESGVCPLSEEAAIDSWIVDPKCEATMDQPASGVIVYDLRTRLTRVE
jgi:hypothetical protein